MMETGTPKPNEAATERPAAQAPVRRFPCEGCGADLEFHIGSVALKCPFCGFEKRLDEPVRGVSERDYASVLEYLATRRGKPSAAESSPVEAACESCTAKIRFHGTLTATRCPYCGAAVQRVGIHEGDAGAGASSSPIGVDGVLPFRVDRDQAQRNLSAWVRSRWFAPGGFRRDALAGRFSGIYLPYWTFDTATTTEYVGQRGEHYFETVGTGKQRRTVLRTRWFPASGRFTRFFDDVLVVAGRGLPERRLAALEPWPLAEARPFDPRLLAGFLAQTYDVSPAEGFVAARARVDELLAAEVRQRIGGDAQRVHESRTRYDAVTFKHLLLPVWMLGYRHRGRTFQVTINACTGEVQGDRPYSTVKILLAVLALVVPLVAIAAMVARS